MEWGEGRRGGKTHRVSSLRKFQSCKGESRTKTACEQSPTLGSNGPALAPGSSLRKVWLQNKHWGQLESVAAWSNQLTTLPCRLSLEGELNWLSPGYPTPGMATWLRQSPPAHFSEWFSFPKLIQSEWILRHLPGVPEHNTLFSGGY